MQDPRAQRDPLVPKVMLAQRVKMESPDHRGHPVAPAQLASQEQRVIKVRPDLRVRPGLRGQRAKPAHPGPQELLV